MMEYLITGGGLLAIVTIVWTFHCQTERKVEAQRSELDSKIDKQVNTLFKRFDQYKTYVEQGFSRTELCNSTHKRVDETLARIENKLDKVINGNQRN